MLITNISTALTKPKCLICQGHLGIPLSREQESNLQPADYKSAALPIELSRHRQENFNGQDWYLLSGTVFNLPAITNVPYVPTPSIRGNTHQPDGTPLSQLGFQEERYLSVPEARLELALPKELDFESSGSTNSPTQAQLQRWWDSNPRHADYQSVK